MSPARITLLFALALPAALAASACMSEGRDPDCPNLAAGASAEEIAKYRAEAEAKGCVTPIIAEAGQGGSNLGGGSGIGGGGGAGGNP